MAVHYLNGRCTLAVVDGRATVAWTLSAGWKCSCGTPGCSHIEAVRAEGAGTEAELGEQLRGLEVDQILELAREVQAREAREVGDPWADRRRFQAEWN